MAGLGFSLKRRLLLLAKSLLIGMIAVTVLNYGSPGATERDVMVLAYAAMTVVSLFRPANDATFFVRAVAALLLAALLGYVAFQTLPLAGLSADWAWEPVRAQLDSTQSAISVAPGATLEALPALALPFLVFLSALVLFQGDAEALFLLRALAYFGAAEAMFGILQQVFFPGQAFLGPKHWYIGSLTATFINRNTAGTFFGLAFLLNLGLTFYFLRQLRLTEFGARLTKGGLALADVRVLVHGALTLCVVIALFLTQSRGANAASFLAAIVAVALTASRKWTADRRSQSRGRWWAFVRGMAGVVVLILVIEVFAGRVAYRVEGQGTDDVRWCTFASAFDFVRRHPAFGAGFGTFQDLFPTYRLSECSGISGIWDRAHNFFLEGLLGLGAPFVIALLVGYGVILRALIRGVRERESLRFAPVVTLAAVILASVHSLVDFSLQIPGVGAYFAAILAAGIDVALGKSSESSRPARKGASRVANSLAIPADRAKLARDAIDARGRGDPCPT